MQCVANRVVSRSPRARWGGGGREGTHGMPAGTSDSGTPWPSDPNHDTLPSPCAGRTGMGGAGQSVCSGTPSLFISPPLRAAVYLKKNAIWSSTGWRSITCLTLPCYKLRRGGGGGGTTACTESVSDMREAVSCTMLNVMKASVLLL